MEYIYRGLRRSVFDPEPLRLTLIRTLDLPEIESVAVEREAIDARKKPDVFYVYNLRFTVSRSAPRLEKLLAEGKIEPFEAPSLPEPEPRITLPERPVIVGFGPAGMFLALHLARMGYRPIVYERGEQVGPRVCAVKRLWRDGLLDPESNMQFGEGGAGTFSDGKLTTGKASPLDRVILETFVGRGAPASILYSSKPHIGTDYLRRVVIALRNEVTALGGEIHFGHKVTDIHVEDGAVHAVTVNGQRVPASAVILAIGHSARDTVEMLHRRGVAMEPKPFAVGLRIEHPAQFVNESQYGIEAAKVLPAADYKLTHRYQGAGVYTFCMCPGGRVVCAASEPERQVTNGMSRYAREAPFSNSAVVVGVDPAGQGWRSPLDGIAFQRGLEGQAFGAGGGGFVAPAQRAADFLRDRASRTLPEASYRPGVASARLHEILPPFVAAAVKAGLQRFDRIMPGFVEKGLLIGVETRTSSPVRIVRDGNCESVSVRGLYLLGEGAGYAGGIMTCARDAIRLARLVVPKAGLAQSHLTRHRAGLKPPR